MSRPNPAPAPMVWAALALTAGVVVDRFGAREAWSTWAWAGLAGAGVALALAPILAGGRAGLVGVALLWLGIGGALHHRHWADLAPDDLARGIVPGDAPRPAWLRGVPVETPVYRPDPAREGTTRTVLAVTAASDGRAWRGASGRVVVWIAGDRTDLVPGLPIELAGGLAPIDGPGNPGERDTRDAWRTDGVRLRLSVDSPRGVWPDPSGAVWPGTYRLGRVRAWAATTLDAGLDPSVAPLAKALLLGRRDDVDPDLIDAFGRTGTTHLLAISGLHLQALALLIFGVARVVGVGHRRSFWAVMLGSTAYAVLVGLAPSVVRSLAMTLVACVAGLIDRPTRPSNLLAIALVVTLVLNPSHLFDVGCQLSFLAVAAIVWGVPAALERLRREPKDLDRLELQYERPWMRTARGVGWRLVEGLVVSAVVWLAALPLTASRFHLTAPVGIGLNVPLVPVTTLALFAAGLALGLSAIWPPLGWPAAWACRWLLTATDVLVRWGASRTWGHWFGPGPPMGLVLAFYAALGLAAAASLNGRGAWTRRVAWGAVLACAGGMVVAPRLDRGPGRAEAEVFAVGHGLAVLVRSGDGRALLYDAGRMGDPHAGRRLVAPALWARGVARLDAVVLSHADADHYNALPDLLDRFPVGEVVLPPGFSGGANPGASALIDNVRARRIPIRTVARGDAWTLGRDVDLSVLGPGPEPDLSASDNARSLVLEVKSLGRRLLLTGDLEGIGLVDLVSLPSPSHDALLAPHHGGRASNPAWFYQWARPALVVSSQAAPQAGTRDPLAPIEALGIPVRRTWKDGAVRLRWSRAGLLADGYLDPPDTPSAREARP